MDLSRSDRRILNSFFARDVRSASAQEARQAGGRREPPFAPWARPKHQPSRLCMDAGFYPLCGRRFTRHFRMSDQTPMPFDVAPRADILF